jgi:uncharacterized protein YegJ (DUF2314 family)
MNSFGLPDASITAQVSIEEGAEILTAFNHRQLIQATRLQDGDEFSLAIQEPTFRIRKVPYGYDEEDLLNNPRGRWHLELTGRRRTLPKELNAGGAPLFMAIPGDDPRLQEAVRKARQTSGYFVASYQSPHEYGIHLFKAAFPDRDRNAYLWLALVDVRGPTLVGEVFEAPAELKLKKGQKVEVKLDDIHDWSIRKSGTVIGGFTLRLNREWIKPHLQRDWELFTGIVNFAPLEEIVS